MSSKLRSPVPAMRGVSAFLSTDQKTDASLNTTNAPIEKISTSSTQPRKYFDKTKMEQLIESIRQHGVLEPLIVRPSANGSCEFELVAGERRLRAAQVIGLNEVPIAIRELSDEEASEIALVENLQREDLNTIEETEGILELLALRLQTSREEVIRVLNQNANAKKREQSLTDNVIRQLNEINKIFIKLGTITPESFRANRLPLLNLPLDVLEILREGKLEYTKARAISRIKDEQTRLKILNEAVQNNLSLNEIKAIINELKTSSNKKVPKTVQNFYDRVSVVTTKLKKSQAWTDKNKRKQAELLLKELENLAE
ncbi:MAG: ParB/RepB/Spo0J family partition protein [Acaryochloris sp. RU_4_1]|nr:ParB/RepB/Spo0J family partition protein [Acaryochloris sp. RU_4_1]NJR57013.1 ParB/RepB/Spo0J family partition protein [Acaryochloris sp. CRU_2_0]